MENIILLVMILVLSLCYSNISSKIVIDINAESEDISIVYYGLAVEHALDNDIKSFFSDMTLKNAVKIHYDTKPSNVYYKKPTPWGDLYAKYNWEEVKKIISVKSARVKTYTKKPLIISTETFKNYRNHSIKVNTGVSHTVENSITTSWSKSREFTISQELEYDVNVIFAKLSGNTGISYTSNWGQSEEKSKSITIGSTSGVETELEPGQSVTAELSVSAGVLEIEVVYKAYLRGNLVVNLKKKLGEHHFLGPRIQDVMKSAGVLNEITFVETIKFGYHVDGNLKVFDKATLKVL